MWAGIGKKVRTRIGIFEGIMDKCLSTEILDSTLVPFIEKEFPDTHRLMQDNDGLSEVVLTAS